MAGSCWERRSWVFHGAPHVVHVNPLLQRVRAADVLRAFQLTHPSLTEHLLPLTLQQATPHLTRAIVRTHTAPLAQRLTPPLQQQQQQQRRHSNAGGADNQLLQKRSLVAAAGADAEEDDSNIVKLLELFLPKKLADSARCKIDVMALKLQEDEKLADRQQDMHQKQLLQQQQANSFLLVKHSPPRRRFSVTRHSFMMRNNGIDDVHRNELEEEVNRANGAAGKKRKTLLPPKSQIETRTAKKRRSLQSVAEKGERNSPSPSDDSSLSSNGTKNIEKREVQPPKSQSTKAKSYSVLRPEAVIWLAFTRFGSLNDRICDELEVLVSMMISPRSVEDNISETSGGDISLEAAEKNEKALWNIWFNVMQSVSALEDESLKGFRDLLNERVQTPSEICPVCEKADLTTSFLLCDGLIGPSHVNHPAYENPKGDKLTAPYFGVGEIAGVGIVSMKDCYSHSQMAHIGKDCTTVTHVGPQGCMPDAVCSKDLRSMLIYPERCWFCAICESCMRCQVTGKELPRADPVDSQIRDLEPLAKRKPRRSSIGLDLDWSMCQMDQSTLFELQARCLQVVHCLMEDSLGVVLYPESTSTHSSDATKSSIQVCLRQVHRNILLLKYLTEPVGSDNKTGSKKQQLPITPHDFLRRFQEDVAEIFKKTLGESHDYRMFKLYDSVLHAIADMREDFIVGVSSSHMLHVRQFVSESRMLHLDHRAYMPLKHFFIYFQRFMHSAILTNQTTNNAGTYWEFTRSNGNSLPSGTDLAVIRQVLKNDSQISQLGITLLSDLENRPRLYPRLSPPGFGSYVDGPFVLGCDVSMSILHNPDLPCQEQ
eukprot:TRINITY_DN47123_c2_g1_i2.p1 TRINITY_DN47123_c2_g1~~TRINITY_DN47123_c2_g1_i2.p1  ORF type:complete len:824 (+),score=178.75 TRINITY_DN47123_c2_g1_i2:26-2497(+)